MSTALAPVSGLTLYSLQDELAQLISVRAEMSETGEDTATIDAAIAEYMQALPEKVDSVAHVIHTLESQIALAKVEEDRLEARRKKFSAALDRLKAYVVDVLSQIPEPKRGSRKIEGSTATLCLVKNGGLEALDITEPTIVPDEMCVAEVRMPWSDWERITPLDLQDRAKRVPDNAAIRAALKSPCWLCAGKDEDCDQCGGTGLSTVPGARLLPRGQRLEVK